MKECEHGRSLRMEDLYQMQTDPFLVSAELGFEVTHTFGPLFSNPEKALCQHFLKHIHTQQRSLGNVWP